MRAPGHFEELFAVDAEARERAAVAVERRRRRDRDGGRAVSTALAIALAIFGIMVLVVLHELGHFFAARAVRDAGGEALPLLREADLEGPARRDRVRRSASIPLGGYAKITGMNPEEELPPEVVPRAYYAQPVWKRCFVILAGPVRERARRVRDPVRPGVRDRGAPAWWSGRRREELGRRGRAPARGRSCRLGRRRHLDRATTCRPDAAGFADSVGSHECDGRAAATAAWRRRRP